MLDSLRGVIFFAVEN